MGGHYSRFKFIIGLIWTFLLIIPVQAEVFKGSLQVMIHDDVDGSVKEHHLLHLGNDKWARLKYESPERQILYRQNGEPISLDSHSEAEVEVDGILENNHIRVNRLTASPRWSEKSSAERVTSTNSNAVKEVNALVLVIGFQGRANNMNVDAVHGAIFGETGRTANAFYWEGSYGTFRMVGIKDPAGDIYGPITLGTNGCDGGYQTSASQAREVARNAGFDVDAYDVIIHVFVEGASGCPGGGIAGGKHANLFVGLSAVWDYGAHEVGHCNVIGSLGHASSSRNCSSESGDVITYGGACTHDEYGDMTDIQGGRNFQFSAYHIERAGWFPTENRTTVTSSKRVSILPLNIPASGIQTVYVPRSGSNDYFNFEFRRPVGFDERLETGLTDGVLVRVTAAPGQRSNPHIIDMTPNNDFRNAALRVGKTFAAEGLKVTTVEVTNEHAVIDIIIDDVPITPVEDAKKIEERSFSFTILETGSLLKFSLKHKDLVKSLEVTDLSGTVLHTLKAVGNYMAWGGGSLSNGIYLIRLNLQDRSIVKQATIIK